jgi:NAD(P)-dependent dehydrogenase (short-subunit alcohol dehydrogenase family)
VKRLDGKVAIITGGGTGIGEATCHRFAEEGARVAIFEIVREAGEKTVAALAERGFEAAVFPVDVTDEKQVMQAVSDVIARWGTVDILVNNAAIPGANTMTHALDEGDWQKVFAVNVKGPFLCSKHVLAHMMAARRGAIVHFSSIYALIGNDDLPPYHATKGAILAMTKTDAICYAPYGIRVNCVHPGSTKTPLFIKAGETYPGGYDAYLQMMQAKHPLPLAEPVDIANCVLFLASDEARFVTGASLVCDGGYTVQ